MAVCQFPVLRCFLVVSIFIATYTAGVKTQNGKKLLVSQPSHNLNEYSSSCLSSFMAIFQATQFAPPKA